jgi:hypothetical protein
MEIFTTIVVAVIVFAASQYALKLILDPIVELKRTMANISSTLLYYQSTLTNATADDEVCLLLKRLSSDLRSDASAVPFYEFLQCIRIFAIPGKENLRKACHGLNWLSYNVSGHATTDSTREVPGTIKEIGALLDIETTY